MAAITMKVGNEGGVSGGLLHQPERGEEYRG